MIDNDKFAEARAAAITDGKSNNLIGTLGEKLIHKTLKYYIEPDVSRHEISYLGHVADIFNENGIFEIQTRSFQKLKTKLNDFLPSERVTVVYPIVENKTICRIDTESGESSPPRKSPKKGRVSDALGEIAMIRGFIPNDRLKIVIFLLDAEETRMVNGSVRIGRKRTRKIDCVPTKLNSVIELSSAEDYCNLLPKELPDAFTSVEFEKCSGLKGVGAHGALMLLLNLGILSRERKGRAPYMYFVNK